MRILLISIILTISINLNGQTQVDFYTNYGDFRVELYDSLMPITTSNFKNLVSTNFYDGAIFHRVIKNFMIQGGDVSPPPPSIPDEFDSTLSNIQKTISMANSGPNTGTCQFFINLVDNTYLDFDKPPFTSKHPVFGITVSGFNIVEDIGDVQTNFNDKKIIHMLIENYLVDNKSYSSLPLNKKCNFFSLDVNFICLSKNFIYNLEKILKKYHILISQILYADYVENFIDQNHQTIFSTASRIKSGLNENEVLLVSKTFKNKGFFEKFFDFFS